MLVCCQNGPRRYRQLCYAKLLSNTEGSVESGKEYEQRLRRIRKFAGLVFTDNVAKETGNRDFCPTLGRNANVIIVTRVKIRPEKALHIE